MRHQISLLLVLILVLGACSSPKNPSAVYEEYNRRVIAGMSFDEEMEYFTSAKQKQVEAQFPRLMNKMNRSRAEVIQIYQRMSRDVASCMQITLIDEQIDGVTASLVYDQTDTCAATPDRSDKNGKQSIRMIYEDGWKIDEIEIAL